jgi:hypothetical protein
MAEMGEDVRGCGSMARRARPRIHRPTWSRRPSHRRSLQQAVSTAHNHTPILLTAAEDDALGADSNVLELLGQSPADQETADIGRDLNTSTDLADRRSSLEERDLVSGLGETKGSGKTAEAAADDDNVERVLGNTALEERGGLWAEEQISRALAGECGDDDVPWLG